MNFKTFLTLIIISVCVNFFVDAALSVVSMKMRRDPVVRLEQDSSSSGQEKSAIGPRAKYNVVVNRDLFGTASRIVKAPPPPPPPPPKEIEVENLPVAKLGLVLVGTIVFDNPDDNLAVIMDKRRRSEATHKVGDKIQNVTIKSIMRYNVVVVNNGRDEVLVMDLDKDKSFGRADPRGIAVKTNDVSLDRDVVGKSLTDIGKVMRGVRISPTAGGDGYILDKVAEKGLLPQLGLQKGDVIKGLNGERITSMDQVMSLYNNFSSLRSVDLNIERNGVPVKMRYNLK